MAMHSAAGQPWPKVRTDRLVLRGWTAGDRIALAAMNADPRVMEFIGEPMTPEQSEAFAVRIEAKFAEQGFGFWAVELVGVVPFIGLVGLNVPSFDAPFMPAVEIGWRLGADHWGRGYASEAADAALRFGFDVMGLEEIVAFTAASNVRSQRVMERLGMTRNPRDDFEHPSLPAGSPLRPHVLYRIRAKTLAGRRRASDS
jgi:ribosomal-protein-alanine N-acetyltransferase